ncbi:MAG: hypothetical protein DYH13_10530 [Alphaproteobacteria bacterium PRO2]|nr:hypothetical protein [Alphaproteobacteria bacterium PRO2]
MLFGILVFLMLTPSLACAMPVCFDKAEAVKANQPCAGHASEHHGDKSEPKSKKAGLMADCMGVDFQKADTASFEKPDLKSDSIHFIMADGLALNNVSHTDAGTIRGPPPDWPALSQTQPSILLTTQRLRI